MALIIKLLMALMALIMTQMVFILMIICSLPDDTTPAEWRQDSKQSNTQSRHRPLPVADITLFLITIVMNNTQNAPKLTLRYQTFISLGFKVRPRERVSLGLYITCTSQWSSTFYASRYGDDYEDIEV